jgi:predicted transcriptional regulator
VPQRRAPEHRAERLLPQSEEGIGVSHPACLTQRMRVPKPEIARVRRTHAEILALARDMIIIQSYRLGEDGMAPATRVLTAHVPAGLADRVDALASRIDRSRGWIMKQALAAWVDQEDERHKLTLEALADVDTGRVIDHNAMVAWANSLSTEAPLPPPGA